MNSGFGVAVAALIALVVFGARDARSQILGDILVLKSGEKVEGRITNESEMNVTISAETPTGQTERMIPRAEISSLTRNEPLALAKTPSRSLRSQRILVRFLQTRNGNTSRMSLPQKS
jgi:hypothetical protein